MAVLAVFLLDPYFSIRFNPGDSDIHLLGIGPYRIALIFAITLGLILLLANFPPTMPKFHLVFAFVLFFEVLFIPGRFFVSRWILFGFYFFQIISWKWKSTFQWSPSLWILSVVFFFWIASLFSYTKGASFISLNKGMIIGYKILCSVFFLTYFQKFQDIRSLMKILMGLIFCAILVGTVQEAKFWLTGSTWTLTDRESTWAYIGGTRIIRVHGFSRHPIYYGMMNMLASLTALYYVVNLKSISAKRKGWLTVASILFFLYMIASFARSTWLGWGMGLFVIILLLNRYRMVRLMIVLTVVISILLTTGAMGQIFDFIIEANQTSVQFRLDQFHYAFEVFFDHPWTGIGASTYPKAPGNYSGTHVHNTVLMVLTEGGVLTCIPYLLFLLFVFVRGLNAYLGMKECKAKFYLGLFFVLYLAKFTVCLANQMFLDSMLYILVALIEAMIYVYRNGSIQEIEDVT